MRLRTVRGAVGLVAAVACGALASGCTSTSASRADATAIVQARPAEADVCFVAMMVPHHRQAVEMSQIVLSKDGVWERGQRFARYVLAAQQAEIRAMEAWLSAWDAALAEAAEQLSAGGSGPRVPRTGTTDAGPAGAASLPGHAGHAGHAGHGVPPEPDAAAMPSCDHAHGGAMDGMLTDEEMDALRQAGAADAQRLYLELMVPHHEGALEMAEQALDAAENEFVRSSAAHVVREQASELESIQGMIAALDAGDLGLPDDYTDGSYLTYELAGVPAADAVAGGDRP